MSEISFVPNSNTEPPAPDPGPATTAHAKPSRGRSITSFLERYGLLLLLIGVMIFFANFWERPSTFRSTDNLVAVIGTYSVPAVLALASMIPLICGRFDLTVGPVAGLTAILCAGMIDKSGFSVGVAIIVALMVGCLVGLVNGFLVAYVGVNAFITTLGMTSIIAGIITLYTDGAILIVDDPNLSALGSGLTLGLPRLAFIVVILALLIYYLLDHTPVGRYLYSVGSNERAATLVGLNVRRLVLLSFVSSSLLASAAGVMLLARNGSADQQLGGLGLTLPALTAAFLGATTIRPGHFNVPGTLVAVLFVGFSLSGLNLNNVENWVTDFFTGAALVLAVAASTLLGRPSVRT